MAILAPRPSGTWRSMNGAATLKPGAKPKTEGERDRSTLRYGSSIRSLRRGAAAGPRAGPRDARWIRCQPAAAPHDRVSPRGPRLQRVRRRIVMALDGVGH